MNQTADRTLRDQLESYAEGHRSFAEFHRWFMTSMVTPLETIAPDAESRRRVYDILRDMAEFEDGIWTEAQLRRRLRRLSREPVLHVAS